MKRPRYADFIRWIAAEDGPGDPYARDPAIVAASLTAVMVADLFGVEALRVGLDVVNERIKGARS